MRRIRTTLIAILSLASIIAQADNRLFHISKNLNSKVVCYDVQLNGDQLDVTSPIKVYWYKPDNDTSWDLNLAQRKLAYGYNVKSVSKSEARVTLKACAKRDMRIRRINGKWVATTTINGKECILTEIYTHCTSNMSCEYVELRGNAVHDNSRQTERIKN